MRRILAGTIILTLGGLPAHADYLETHTVGTPMLTAGDDETSLLAWYEDRYPGGDPTVYGRLFEPRSLRPVGDIMAFPGIYWLPVVGFDGAAYLVKSGVAYQVRAGTGATMSPRFSQRGLESFAANSSGLLLVWTNPANPTVLAQRVSSSGVELGPVLTLASAPSGDLLYGPVVATTGAEYLVAWTHQDAESRSVAFRMLTADGRIGSDIIRGPDDAGWAPMVASNGEGFLVAWAWETGLRHTRQNGVSAVRVDADGTVLDAAPIALASSPAQTTGVVSDGADYLVTWTRISLQPSEPDTAQVLRVGADGTLGTIHDLPIPNGKVFAYDVAVLGGAYTVVSSDTMRVLALRLTSDGEVAPDATPVTLAVASPPVLREGQPPIGGCAVAPDGAGWPDGLSLVLAAGLLGLSRPRRRGVS